MSTRKNLSRNTNARKRGFKKGVTVNQSFAKPERKHASENMKPKKNAPHVTETLGRKDSSSMLKVPVDFLHDDNMEVDFDPPLHSTAVYADGEEPLDKEDMTTEQAKGQPPLIPSASEKISQTGMTSRSTEDSSVQRTVIKKIQKKPSKAKLPLEEPAHLNVIKPPDRVRGHAAETSRVIPKDKRKSTSMESQKVQSPSPDPGAYSIKSPENLFGEAVQKSRSRLKGNKRGQKRAINLKTPSQEQNPSTFKSSHDVGDEEAHTSGVTPRSRKRARRSNANLIKKVQTDSQRHAPQGIGSSDEVDDAANTSPAPSITKKRKRTLDISERSVNRTQDISTRKVAKKPNTKESSAAGPRNKTSLKAWSSEEVPRTCRDMNELDVVLFECEKVFEEIRETIQSNACVKAVDHFFDNFKTQLTSSIEDAQKLKNVEKKNAKLTSEIKQKQKRLIEVRGELLQNEAKLKQLRRRYSEMQGTQSALKDAEEFLSNLGDLQRSYLMFREENPKNPETYGVCSLPALLLEAQNVLHPEKHICDINRKLKDFIGEDEQ